MSDLIERLLAFYGLLGAAVFKEAADTIEAQAKRIAELEAENFALAAGMCIHPDKLLGDEGGTLVCTLRADLVAMTRERDVAKHNEQCTHDANKRVLKQLTATEAALTVAREALLRYENHPIAEEPSSPRYTYVARKALTLLDRPADALEAAIKAERERVAQDVEAGKFGLVGDEIAAEIRART